MLYLYRFIYILIVEPVVLFLTLKTSISFCIEFVVNPGLSNRSKCIKGSTHYLGDKQGFDVSSEGPSFVYSLPTLATV